jgi:hypothetical protein
MSAFVALAIGGVEVTTPGYARRPTTLAYAYDGVTLCNLTSIQWPVATASWGVIDTVLLYDAVTGGSLIATLPTVVPIEIRQYDIARIPASGIAMPPVVTPTAFGAIGLGDGAFTSRGYDVSVGGVFRAGAFGSRGYGAIVGVPLERAFDQVHVCSPGVWAKAA